MKPGDWRCPSCHCHNFASRTSCFRCNAPGTNYDGVRFPPGPDMMGEMHNQQMDGYSGNRYSNSSRPSQYRPGDWVCPKPICRFQNFASRTECMRCGSCRVSGSPEMTGGGMHSGMSKPMMGTGTQVGVGMSSRILPGDWACPNCNVNNFASRTRCVQCGSPNVRIASSRPSGRPGDWTCPNETCAYHNFASRDECYRCGNRKIPGMEVPSLFNMYNSGLDMMGVNCGSGGVNAGEASSDYLRNSDTSYSNSLKVKPGDWICTSAGCGFINFARRETCAQCDAPPNPAIIEGPPGVPQDSMNNTYSTFLNYDKLRQPQRSPPSASHSQIPGDSE